MPLTLFQAELLHLLPLCFLGILHIMSGGASQLDIGVEVLFNYWGEREEGEEKEGQRGRKEEEGEGR